jgi:hypothetical protein
MQESAPTMPDTTMMLVVHTFESIKKRACPGMSNLSSMNEKKTMSKICNSISGFEVGCLDSAEHQARQ